jgi:Tol biopolymer transport system component
VAEEATPSSATSTNREHALKATLEISNRVVSMKTRRFQIVLVPLSMLLLSICIAAAFSNCQSRPDQSRGTDIPTVELSVEPLPEPTPMPDGNGTQLALSFGTSLGEIAYLSNRTGVAEIWLLDLDTGSQRQLTETNCRDISIEGYLPGVQDFTWAPNGQKIAHLATCTPRGHQARLSVVDLLTSDVISITNLVGSSSYPSWAPSSDRLVFARDVLTTCEIYIVEFNEGEFPGVESVASATWEDSREGCFFYPVWSPDGDHIAYRGPFVGIPGVGGRTYVSIVDLEGNHMVYEPAGILRTWWIFEPLPSGLAWSNSGQYLAIATEHGYDSARLNLIEVTNQSAVLNEGFALMEQSTGRPSPFGPGFYNPVFSPNDNVLYFVSSRLEVEDTSDLFPFGTIFSVPVQDLFDTIHPDIRVVSSENQLAGFPSLSPNGEWLIYAVKVGEATEVWIQAVDGTHRQQLVGDGFVNTQPAWRPSSK